MISSIDYGKNGLHPGTELSMKIIKKSMRVKKVTAKLCQEEQHKLSLECKRNP